MRRFPGVCTSLHRVWTCWEHLPNPQAAQHHLVVPYRHGIESDAQVESESPTSGGLSTDPISAFGTSSLTAENPTATSSASDYLANFSSSAVNPAAISWAVGKPLLFSRAAEYPASLRRRTSW